MDFDIIRLIFETEEAAVCEFGCFKMSMYMLTSMINTTKGLGTAAQAVFVGGGTH